MHGDTKDTKGQVGTFHERKLLEVITINYKSLEWK